MASTFENNLRLEEIGTGEQSGTWGTKTNVNLELITDGLSYSSTGEAIANASTHTITMADGVADEFRSFYLKCTGGGQACTVTLAPNTLSKVWVIENTTSYTLTFSQGSGANVAILAGQVKMIATDGAGSGAAVFDLMQDLAVPDLFVDDDLNLQSDGAVINFGVNAEIQLTHVHDVGLLLTETGGGAPTIQFRDSAISVSSSADATLDLAADGDINLTAGVDINIPANVGLTFGNDAEKIEGDGTDLTIAGNNINLTAVADVVIPANVGITFGTGEKIEGDNTDITITSGADINLTATADINVPSGVGLTFGDDGEKIEGDGTDLTINASNDLNLTAATDINIPANVGLTFGDDGEKIEGDGTDLTISGNNINLTAVADIVVPANVGITFGTGEKIEGDNTDLTITSGAKINLAATSDVHLANNIGMVFGDSGEKIEGDGTNLAISSSGELDITATTVDIEGALDVSSTYTGGGLMTTGGNIVIPNAGNIGSAGDTDAIAIASDGQVTFSQAISGTSATFTTADNDAQLTLVSTDADEAIGPLIIMKRDSSSPAADDQMGKIRFVGEDSTDAEVVYSEIVNQIKDPTNNSEDGRMAFNVMSAGTGASFINMTHSGVQAETVFNDESRDIDFRVESNGNANMLFVDGAQDAVLIGHNSSVNFNAESHELQVFDTNFSLASFATYRNGSDGANIALGHSRNATIGSHTVVNDGDQLGAIAFYGSDGTDFEQAARVEAQVDGTPAGDTTDMPGRLVFLTTADGSDSPTERMNIQSNGNVRFGAGNGHSPLIQGTTNSGRTEGSPGYSFNDDLNTGMFQPLSATDTIAFSTGGTERMRITSAGNVSLATGTLTANAGVVVDEMTLDGDTLTATDTFTIDAVSDISLDADTGNINLKDGGTAFGLLARRGGSNSLVIQSTVANADFIIRGNDSDGGGDVDALSFDMSEAGAATFNSGVTVGGGLTVATNLAIINSTSGSVFNNDRGGAIDFRVASGALNHAFFVDAGEDKVFIGHNTTHQYDAYGAEIILQIEAAGTAPYAGIGMIQNSNDTDSAPLIFGKSRGTSVGSTTIVQDDDLLGRIEFQGMDGGDLETGASIFAAVDGTPGTDSMPGRLTFNTTASGAHSATERMRIDSSGDVTINRKIIVSAADGVADADYVGSLANLEATAGRSFGLSVQAGSNGSDIALNVINKAADTALLRVFGDGTTTIANTITLSDGNLAVASGHGIDFSAQTATSASGATTNSELLDHYEEGTFTPDVGSASGSGGSTTGSKSGTYTRIGNRVFAELHLSIGGLGSMSGNFFIVGFPFASAGVLAQGAVRSQGIGGSNDIPVAFEMVGSASYGRFHFMSGTSGQRVVQVSDMSASDFIALSICYTV